MAKRVNLGGALPVWVAYRILTPFGRGDASYHVADELGDLVRGQPQPVGPPYAGREGQDAVYPGARQRGDADGARLEVGEAGRDEVLYLAQAVGRDQVALVDDDPARGAGLLYLARDPEVPRHDAVDRVNQEQRDVGAPDGLRSPQR